MQLVEDMEEGVLRLGQSGKLLDIIHDEHVNVLVEIDEVVGCIVSHRVGVLHLKEVS